MVWSKGKSHSDEIRRRQALFYLGYLKEINWIEMYAHSKQKQNIFKQDKCVGNFLKVQKDTDQAGYVFSLQYCYLYILHESLKKEIY